MGRHPGSPLDGEPSAFTVVYEMECEVVETDPSPLTLTLTLTLTLSAWAELV